MAEKSRTCPQCGGQMVFRLGEFHCQQCGVALGADAFEGPSFGGDLRPGESSGVYGLQNKRHVPPKSKASRHDPGLQYRDIPIVAPEAVQHRAPDGVLRGGDPGDMYLPKKDQLIREAKPDDGPLRWEKHIWFGLWLIGAAYSITSAYIERYTGPGTVGWFSWLISGALLWFALYKPQAWAKLACSGLTLLGVCGVIFVGFSLQQGMVMVPELLGIPLFGSMLWLFVGISAAYQLWLVAILLRDWRRLQ